MRYREPGRPTPEFHAWMNMIQRCTATKWRRYADYGGRGIRVCERWMSSFEAFLEDMGARPTPHHSLDRIDNNGNYEPGNCRWATRKEQYRNRRSNHVVTVGNTTAVLSDWAAAAGINKVTLRSRLKRGWSPEMAVATPARPRSPR